jgi:hypothetical protein
MMTHNEQSAHVRSSRLPRGCLRQERLHKSLAEHLHRAEQRSLRCAAAHRERRACLNVRLADELLREDVHNNVAVLHLVNLLPAHNSESAPDGSAVVATRRDATRREAMAAALRTQTQVCRKREPAVARLLLHVLRGSAAR